MMTRAVLLSVTYKLAASPSPRSFTEMQILLSNPKPGPQKSVITSSPGDS